jgi:hypothetical protein
VSQDPDYQEFAASFSEPTGSVEFWNAVDQRFREHGYSAVALVTSISRIRIGRSVELSGSTARKVDAMMGRRSRDSRRLYTGFEQV